MRVTLVILILMLSFFPSSLAEPSPMRYEYHGDPIISINVTYSSGPNGGDSFEGEIVLELFIHWAPITVNNFIELVNQSFFDGIFYHRIIDDFVIQSGDNSCVEVIAYPATNPSCGEGGSEQNIPFESNENLTHIDGAIGMARGVEADSATSQFYICDGPQHGLDNGNRTLEDDPGYAVFGVVREGMELVQMAAAVPTTNDWDGGTEPVPRVGAGPDRPLYEVHINSITMIGFVGDNITVEIEEGKAISAIFILQITTVSIVACVAICVLLNKWFGINILHYIMK